MNDWTDRDIALRYVMSFLGTPYVWGGDNPNQGFDCSGLVCEYLRCLGVIDKEDYTARELLYGVLQGRFDIDAKPETLSAGDLVFYEITRTEKIFHVAIMLNQRYQLHAGGGTSSTTSISAAIAADAFVKIGPLKPPVIHGEAIRGRYVQLFDETGALCLS